MWVKVEFVSPSEVIGVRVNLANAFSVEEFEEFFRLNYSEADYHDVRKTPEMVEAYNSLVPVESQPVRPAEPFRITGTGLYEMMNGESVHIATFDKTADDGVPWVSDKGHWYDPNGNMYAMPLSDGRHIVKLIKLDEVQP